MRSCNLARFFERRKIARLGRGILIVAVSLLSGLWPWVGSAEDTGQGRGTNSFPTVAEVFQGRIFTNKFERAVFFLRAIHDRYPSHWGDLLEVNITLADYAEAPAKFLEFVDELGAAMKDRNDAAASARLGLILSEPGFFTNADAYHPEILRAAAKSLIQFGPIGCEALAASINERHYRLDVESLEELVRTIGEEQPSDPELAQALAATAFDFSTANGGMYPRCTTEAVKNLLRLPGGVLAVRGHLGTNEVFGDPVRFQAVVDGIASAQATALRTNLAAIGIRVETRLALLANSPGDYREALAALQERIRKTTGNFEGKEPEGH
jgi:hypothetical protein